MEYYANLSYREQYLYLQECALDKLHPIIATFCMENSSLPIETIDWIQQNIFYDIPFHYGTRITEKGCVANLYEGILVEETLASIGYPSVTVTRDGNGRSTTAHIHRLLALTFLKPEDMRKVHDLQVNHKDGIKTNYELSNLEWVTKQQNCDHAYRTGLRSDNVHLKLTNAITDEEHIVHSYGEAGRFTSSNPGSIHGFISRNGITKPYKGYFIEVLNDKDPLLSNM